MGGQKKEYINDACRYAAKGDLKRLRKAVEKDPKSIFKFDERL